MSEPAVASLPSTEEERVARAVAGDEDALSALLLESARPLRLEVAAALGARWQSVLEADDVLQVTYLEAFLRIGGFSYRGPGSFRAWLARIARNNVRDAIRELERLKRPPSERRIEATGDDSTFALLDQLGITTATPSRHAAARESRELIEQALLGLPEDYAAVVRGLDLEGRPAAEVAAGLDRSEGAVYMLRARAHDRLRESLGRQSRFFTGSA
jgi:RNA polymerase sigma-70 factor (ECF subfamily)